MSKIFNFVILVLSLSACNSVYVKPNTLDANEVFYVDRGGYSMKRSIKEVMESRGYDIVVGYSKFSDGASSTDIEEIVMPSKAKYIVQVSERTEILRPIWCAFNGFWWWNFNVSIASQDAGKEILSWRGRGCANSSVRMLNRILDDMEK